MANADAVVSGRNFLVYSTPYDADNALPANTVDYGSAWGTPTGQAAAWVNRGYTTGGLAFSMGLERGEIRVDQEFFPVVTPITGATLTMTTELAEITADNMQLASGIGTVTDTDAQSGVRGQHELAVGSTFADDANSWGYDIQKPDDEAIRIAIWKGRATGSPAPSFTPDNPASIALEVTALVDTGPATPRIATFRDIVAALS